MDIWESQTVLKISFLKVFINVTYKLGPQLVIESSKKICRNVLAVDSLSLIVGLRSEWDAEGWLCAGKVL